MAKKAFLVLGGRVVSQSGAVTILGDLPLVAVLGRPFSTKIPDSGNSQSSLGRSVADRAGEREALTRLMTLADLSGYSALQGDLEVRAF